MKADSLPPTAAILQAAERVRYKEVCKVWGRIGTGKSSWNGLKAEKNKEGMFVKAGNGGWA